MAACHNYSIEFQTKNIYIYKFARRGTECFAIKHKKETRSLTINY